MAGAVHLGLEAQGDSLDSGDQESPRAKGHGGMGFWVYEAPEAEWKVFGRRDQERLEVGEEPVVVSRCRFREQISRFMAENEWFALVSNSLGPRFGLNPGVLWPGRGARGATVAPLWWWAAGTLRALPGQALRVVLPGA